MAGTARRRCGGLQRNRLVTVTVHYATPRLQAIPRLVDGPKATVGRTRAMLELAETPRRGLICRRHGHLQGLTGARTNETCFNGY